jgi:hypothetical protein
VSIYAIYYFLQNQMGGVNVRSIAQNKFLTVGLSENSANRRSTEKSVVGGVGL